MNETKTAGGVVVTALAMMSWWPTCDGYAEEPQAIEAELMQAIKELETEGNTLIMSWPASARGESAVAQLAQTLCRDNEVTTRNLFTRRTWGSESGKWPTKRGIIFSSDFFGTNMIGFGGHLINERPNSNLDYKIDLIYNNGTWRISSVWENWVNADPPNEI